MILCLVQGIQEEKTELMNRYNLKKGALQQRCSETNMSKIEKFISWQEVGAHLPGINRRDLVDIDIGGTDWANKKRLLLEMWEVRNGKAATYDAMAEAMLRAGKTNEARKLCKILRPGQIPMVGFE